MALLYTANIVVAAAFAAFVVLMAPAYELVSSSAFGYLARPLVEFSWWATLLAAVLAGWLMGLLTWLVSASQNSISAFVSVWLVAFVIGYGHLPHSIAGTVEVLFGLFANQGVSVAEFGRFLVLSPSGTSSAGRCSWGCSSTATRLRPAENRGRCGGAGGVAVGAASPLAGEEAGERTG